MDIMVFYKAIDIRFGTACIKIIIAAGPFYYAHQSIIDFRGYWHSKINKDIPMNGKTINNRGT